MLTFGPYHFKTQKAALAFFNKIRAAGCPGFPLVGCGHQAAVRDLFSRHPEAGEKAGLGIKAFTVQEVEKTGAWSRCFAALRTDGSTEIFSARKCIMAKVTSLTRCAHVFRYAVADISATYKRDWFGDEDAALCPPDMALYSWAETDVDHEQPWTFSAILAAFLTAEGIDPALIKYQPEAVGERFADASLSHRFRAFHGDGYTGRAKLRVISRALNQALGNRERTNKEKPQYDTRAETITDKIETRAGESRWTPAE